MRSPFVLTGKSYTSEGSSKLEGIFTEKAPCSELIFPAAINWLLFLTTVINSFAVTLYASSLRGSMSTSTISSRFPEIGASSTASMLSNFS